MEYKNLILDFMDRTRMNLEYIEEAHRNEPSADVYEVTQLINSLLGLIVFPKEAYYKSIPETALAELAAQGWKIPHVSGKFEQVQDLQQLMRYLRNAISHSNLEFISDGHQLTGIRLWNCNRSGHKNWQVDMKLEDLREITFRFMDLIIQDPNVRHFDKRSKCQKGLS